MNKIAAHQLMTSVATIATEVNEIFLPQGLKPDGWYQGFYTKKKKGKNKSFNAKQVPVIDKDKQR